MEEQQMPNVTYNTEHVEKYIKSGDKIYVTYYDSESGQHDVDEDVALNVDYIVLLSEETVKKYNLNSSTGWWYQKGPGQEEHLIGYVNPSKDAQGYDSYGFFNLPLESLEGAKVVNQFIWPEKYQKGHADALGDGIYLTEKDAKEDIEDAYGDKMPNIKKEDMSPVGKPKPKNG